MAFEVKMIADSISDAGKRLRTFQLKYPRFIHAEFMTHREFSRNASSSRAIPVAKMIEMVRNEPAMPIQWGTNQPGMQAGVELNGEDLTAAQTRWRVAADKAASYAEDLMHMGLHKQVANRILEPFQWITVVATTSSMTNFKGLRRHKDAQPEIKHLADMAHEVEEASTPQLLLPGQWHLPYINEDDWATAERFCQVGRITRDMPGYDEVVSVLKKMSAARCARVSYLTHEGRVPDLKADLDLFDRLVGAQPLHASPTEHQATPDVGIQQGFVTQWMNPDLHGNLSGWVQHRKQLHGEYISV